VEDQIIERVTENRVYRYDLSGVIGLVILALAEITLSIEVYDNNSRRIWL
jgi:hypothetical protein